MLTRASARASGKNARPPSGRRVLRFLHGCRSLLRHRRGTARDTLGLRTRQAAHQLEVLLFQAQSRAHPYVGDVEQLLVAHGVEMLTAAEHGLQSIAAPLVAPDVILHGCFPGPVLCED